jgi:hypothetical protein
MIKYVYGNDSINPEKFIDLGSGSGKAVISAAALYPFDKCVGIEYLDKLYELSLFHKKLYEEDFPKLMVQNKELFEFHNKPSSVEFIKGNFMAQDWSDGSVVLATSNTYDDEILEGMFARAQLMKPGSFFIHVGQKMPYIYANNWQSIHPIRRLMSWGISKLFIHRKI